LIFRFSRRIQRITYTSFVPRVRITSPLGILKMQLFPLPNCQRTTWQNPRGIHDNHRATILFRRLPRIGLTRSGRTFLWMRRLAVRFASVSYPQERCAYPGALRLSCGDEGDRTLNLRLAKPALSQLSYVPALRSEYVASRLNGGTDFG
jgi:hypothetical protein